MQSSDQLQTLLHSVNRKSYPAYKSLRGAYQFDRYILSIDHVQGDPFASPSHISVKLTHRDTGFPAEYYKDTLTQPLHLPGKRLRKKRSDFCQSLWSGSPRTHSL